MLLVFSLRYSFRNGPLAVFAAAVALPFVGTGIGALALEAPAALDADAVPGALACQYWAW